MKAKTFKNGLPLLLVLSLCLNLILFLLYLNTSQPPVFTVPGTYCSAGVPSHYVILTGDGRYCRYRPSEIQEIGTYVLREENRVYFLEDGAKDREYCAVLLEGSLFLCEDGNVFQLDKQSDVPYYNNVPAVLD